MTTGKLAPPATAEQPNTPSRLPWVPVTVFVLLTCAIGAAGLFMFNRYQEGIKKEANASLGAIADLRVQQLSDWRRSRLANAEVLSHDPMLVQAVDRWIRRGTPQDTDARQIAQRLETVKQAHGYQAAFILDEHGTVRNLPIEAGAKPPTAYGILLVMQAMRSRQAIISDFHRGTEEPLVRLDLVVPLLAGNPNGERAIAGIYFRIDPLEYLFPLLRSWPTPSPSAETVLVRREGDEVVFLNNVRHRDNTALQLRIKVAKRRLLAAMIERGEEGLIEGIDYRDIAVIGTTRKIPDSPWFMVAKIDREELYAPIRRTAWIVTILTLAFITGAGAATILWWRQQRAQFSARQYQEELRHQALMQRSEEQVHLLLESTAEAIYGVDLEGNITFVNPACVRLLGYEREDELLGRLAHELFHHSHADGSAYPREKCLIYQAHLQDQGMHVDDEVFWRKDGTAFPVEYWSYPIRQGEQVEGSVVTFLDITERRQAEQQLRLAAQVFDNSREAIFITDATNRIVSVNQAFIDITGYTRAEAIGNSPSLLKSGRHDAAFFRTMMNALQQDGYWQGEIWNKRKSGEIYPVWMAISAVRNKTGEATHYVAIYSDISEIKTATEKLRKLSMVAEETGNSVVITDRQGIIEYVNPAFTRLTGYTLDEAIGQTPRLIKSGQTPQEYYQAMWKTLLSGRDWRGEFLNRKKNGELFWEKEVISPLRNEAGEITHFVAVKEDITELKHYVSQIERQANYDELTGLANRNLFQDRLNQALTLARRHTCGLAVLFIDLDNFKHINDSLGHDAGDTLLTQVAGRLTGSVREGDTVARQGGDEFVLILSEIKEETDVPGVAQKILMVMAAPFDIGGREIRVTCSIGIASYPKDGEDRQTLLKNADAAMYRAKELGRNNIQYYAAEMNVRAMERLMLENSLYHAVVRNEFLLHYQPQVDLRSGEISGMEALVRWKHPELGLISPATFIPVAEDSGLIVAIGEWVLRTACAQNVAWQRAGLKPISVSVNLSARQFRQPDLAERIAAILRETGLDPAHLELELTESLVMQDVEKTIATLGRLKAMGIKLSIDDFGTGYSSLNYLKRFPIHTLKIDQSFVRDITTDPSDAAIAKTIISMAHELGLMVIAEGVETEEQQSFLRLRRCDEMQGYFFSKPVPAEDFETLLREGRGLRLDDTEAAAGERTLLLLDDEENILTSLTRLLRRDGYKILRATHALAAMDLLAQNRVGVIISDQRMPEMSGVEFLRRVKRLYPDTVRMVLSGYTDLKSVTDAINEGAVYKFLTKPWDDDLLRANIQEAFQRYELAQDNQRLTDNMAAINEELYLAKQELEKRVEQRTTVLQISQEIFAHLPVGLIGVGEDGLIAIANDRANEWFDTKNQLPLVGSLAADRLPRVMVECLTRTDECHDYQFEDGRNVICWGHALGTASEAEGRLLVLLPNKTEET